MLFDKHTSTQVIGVAVANEQTVKLITNVLYNALEVGTANLDKINEEQHIGIEFSLKLLSMLTTLDKFQSILHSNKREHSVELHDIKNIELACHLVIEGVNDYHQEVKELLNKISEVLEDERKDIDA